MWTFICDYCGLENTAERSGGSDSTRTPKIPGKTQKVHSSQVCRGINGSSFLTALNRCFEVCETKSLFFILILKTTPTTPAVKEGEREMEMEMKRAR